MAPIKATVLPLVKNKEELTDKAKTVFNMLKPYVNTQYDEKDAIGRRYRRQDAIGTPFCITVDFDTLENDTVTVRERDTLKQERMHIDELASYIKKHTDLSTLLTKLVD